jgi:glycosyltransferase involved in cell wall biosynthesis
MRIVYVLLSPTPGMHQYTGDLAAQMVAQGCDVHVVTTTAAQPQRDCYPSAVTWHCPVQQRSTGFKPEGFNGREMWHVRQYIMVLQPHVVHFGGVHLWNPLLVSALRRGGLVVVHTLHDLDPHPDVAYGPLIRLWNRTVIASADGLVVHGERYRERLLAAGRQPETVLATPLLHSFLAAEDHERLVAQQPQTGFEPWALFFGRFERYKGIDVLLQAQLLLARQARKFGMVLAGSGDFRAVWPHPLPAGVTLHNRRIEGEEGTHLFQRCGLLVLPYTGATQSALPATAYAFGKPVIVTTSGALPEIVQQGVTGWIVPAGDAEALANCLASVLDDPDHLARAGVAGRHWYVEKRCRQQLELRALYSAAIASRSLHQK